MKARREINTWNKAEDAIQTKLLNKSKQSRTKKIVQLLGHSVEAKAQKFRQISPKELVLLKWLDSQKFHG